MSKMTNCQNDHGGRELNGEPTHTIIWEPYGILQSFVPHSLHSFNDFILLFIHSFPIRLLSHSFSYSSTLTVIPFNLTISLWHENETLSWIAKTSKNGHFCVTTRAQFSCHVKTCSSDLFLSISMQAEFPVNVNCPVQWFPDHISLAGAVGLNAIDTSHNRSVQDMYCN